MKKYVLSGIAALVVVGFSTFNLILNLNNEGSKKNSSLTLDNMAAFTDENGGSGDASECNIYVYNRNYAENYENYTSTVHINAGGTFTFLNRTFTVNFTVEANYILRVPVCVYSPGNCCKKTHPNSPVLRHL